MLSITCADCGCELTPEERGQGVCGVCLAVPRGFERPRYLKEFPEFRGVVLPPPGLPAGFRDESWGNDTCPRFWSPALRVAVWFRHPDPAERWDEDERLYLVERTDEDGYGESADVLYEGDDWGEALAAIRQAGWG